MKKLILGIIVFIILGGAGYWYFTSSQGESSPRSLPSIPLLLSPERSLQGVWVFKEVYVEDPATGEFKLQTPQENKKNSYLEFRGDQFCPGGQLDPERKPYPCPRHQQFSVSGDKISIEDPSQPMTAYWKIASADLELVLELPAGEGGKTQRVKFVLTRL